jgi:putative ABC transport system ATP-binding protein
MEVLISLQQVEKTYKIKGGLVHALRGIDFTVNSGEFVALVGPSGSGKSTLINMITGIDRPTEGEVYVAGQRLTHMGEDRVAGWRGKTVGVVFQFFQLLPSLTVVENVIMPMSYASTFKGQRQERALELLDLVDLLDVADKYPSQISGGQQQRAAIARALANDPPLIVGDEPTGNLDAVSSGLMFSLFEDLIAQGKTMVMVTHDKDLAGKVPRVQEVRDGYLLDSSEVNRRLISDNGK